MVKINEDVLETISSIVEKVKKFLPNPQIFIDIHEEEITLKLVEGEGDKAKEHSVLVKMNRYATVTYFRYTAPYNSKATDNDEDKEIADYIFWEFPGFFDGGTPVVFRKSLEIVEDR
ncbi:MAG TPA: hypothetical protein ENF81_07235 [Thermotogaceae bacterium]|nr:hypothetical protein [Thermotogaceae bacterium]